MARRQWFDVPATDSALAASLLNDLEARKPEVAFGPINVRDYGADPANSAAANDAAFGAAVAAANSSTGGGTRFVVPRGIYSLGATLTFTKPVIIEGEGAGIVVASDAATVLNFNAAITGISLSSAAQYSKVRDIYLKSASSIAGTDHGITSKAHATEISGCVIEDFGGNGVDMDTSGSGNANNSVLRRVRCLTNLGHGFLIKGTNSNVALTDSCDASANGGWGYRFENVAQCTSINCHGDLNVSGIVFDNGNTNQWYNMYSEAGVGHNATLSGSNYIWMAGAYANPTLTLSNIDTALVWRSGGFERQICIQDEAQSHDKYKFSTGQYSADYLALTNVTDGVNILNVDGGSIRLEMLIPLAIGSGGNTINKVRFGTATLVAGTVTVSETATTAISAIQLTGQNASGTHGELGVSARTVGTNFTITSSNAADTRLVAWLMIVN